MGKRYAPEIKGRARDLFVVKLYTVDKVVDTLADELGEKAPARSTVNNWTNEKDAQGKTWRDYQEEQKQSIVTQMSPEGLARVCMQRTWNILNDPSLSGTQLGNALSQMLKVLEKMVDPRMQVHVILQALIDLVTYTKDVFPEVVTKEYLESIRSFKNRVYSRLGGNFTLDLPMD